MLQSLSFPEMGAHGRRLMPSAPVYPVKEEWRRGQGLPEQAGEKSFHLLKAYPDHCRCFFLNFAMEDLFLRGSAGAGAGNTFAREMTSAA